MALLKPYRVFKISEIGVCGKGKEKESGSIGFLAFPSEALVFPFPFPSQTRAQTPKSLGFALACATRSQMAETLASMRRPVTPLPPPARPLAQQLDPANLAEFF
jgi:hypothetical protein